MVEKSQRKYLVWGGTKGCELHLLICNSRMIWGLMITEINKKGRAISDPAFALKSSI